MCQNLFQGQMEPLPVCLVKKGTKKFSQNIKGQKALFPGQTESLSI